MLNEVYDDKRPFSFSTCITALATVFFGGGKYVVITGCVIHGTIKLNQLRTKVALELTPCKVA